MAGYMVFAKNGKAVEARERDEQPDQTHDEMETRCHQSRPISLLRHRPKCNSFRRRQPGIAQKNGAYYAVDMQTISVKLPDDVSAQLTKKARTMRVTKSFLVR